MPSRRGYGRPWLTWLLLCLLALAGLPALAQDLDQASDGLRDAIVERRWLDDPDSRLSPQAALEGAWTPFTGPLSRGFTASTTWVRVKIDPAAAGPASLLSDQRLVLTIAPSQLDEVAVYRADQLSTPPVLVGDTHPVAGPQQGLLHHAIVLDEVVEPIELLLRLRTQGTHSLHVQALRWDDASALAGMQSSLMAGYLVFTVIAIVWAGLTWLQHRHRVAALFMAHQISALLVAVTLLGVLRLHGPPALQPGLSDLTSYSIALSTSLTLMFHRAVLADVGASRLACRLVSAVAAVPAFAMVLMAFDEFRAGLWLTQIAIAAGLVLCTAIACRLRPSLEAGREITTWRRIYLVTVYALMAAAMVPQSLRVLGLMPAGPWSYVGFQAYSVVSAIMLGSLLLLNAQDDRVRRRRAAAVFAQAQREAQAQRARVAEQAELMTMLTHELKTPLSVVSLALGSAGAAPTMHERARRAVGDMRDVIDRCAQAARLDDDVERHDSALSIATVNLHELVAQTLVSQLQAERVDLQVAKNLPPCLADRQMLGVVVTNLLENALKYSPEQSRVQVFLDPKSSGDRPGICLRVLNAVGAAGPPDAQRIFEKYHRGERARHRSGSGLGLYLSRRLAYRMGGELALGTAANDQVCFELWMPC